MEIAEKHLALAILHVQCCSIKKAQQLIEKINTRDLQQLLNENWEVLFDFTNKNGSKSVSGFSEISSVLFGVCPDVLAELFVNLSKENKAVTLGKILKVKNGVYFTILRICIVLFRFSWIIYRQI